MRLPIIVALLCLFSCKDAPMVEIRNHPVSDTVYHPLTYSETRQRIDSLRESLENEFRSSDSGGKKKVLQQAKLLLTGAVSDQLFQYWNGTPWDFNGSSLEPKTGKIACGYFVTTILKHAAVNLNRTKLSTVPSLTMMKELTSSKNIRNQSRLSFTEFCNWMNLQKQTVFIVGLDYHTGFLVNDGTHSWFIHSNYINKKGVMKEFIETSIALKSSSTRYVACLTNEDFLEKWLLR